MEETATDTPNPDDNTFAAYRDYVIEHGSFPGAEQLDQYRERHPHGPTV